MTTAADWLCSPRVTALLAQFAREDAREKLKAYKQITSTAEKWDRLLAWMDLARDMLDHGECGDGCLACTLRKQADKMLEGR